MAAQPEYYLSTYLEEPTWNALAVMRHDQCMALWERVAGRVHLRRYWELERVTGFKHHRIPLLGEDELRVYVNHLLSEEGLSLNDMTAVWGTPLLSTDSGFTGVVPAGQSVHSVAHLFSALGVNMGNLNASAVLGFAFDAGPDNQLEKSLCPYTYSGCYAPSGGDLEIFPVESPGVLWLRTRGVLGYEEGTLMALGSACSFQVPTSATARTAELSFWSQSDAFVAADAVLDLVVRAAEKAVADPLMRLECNFDKRFSEAENIASAVVKEVERASWAIVDRTVDRAILDYNIRPEDTVLALAGGYVLNCPNNSRMMNKYKFRTLQVPPCASDSGQALGIGVMALYERGLTAGLSPIVSAAAGRMAGPVQTAVDRYANHVVSVSNMDERTIVDDLMCGPVAWVEGRAEMGPRALGHRSLLADPRSVASRDKLNEMKRRQWWRPVAPIVLEEWASEWFDCERPSPFMLEVAEVLSEARSLIPAVVHLDGSARLQTVSQEFEPALYRVLKAFYEDTGVPVLGNTSLNDRGEPIVDSASEALAFCIRRGVRVAYLDGIRVELRPDETLAMPSRDGDAFKNTADAWGERWREWQEATSLDPICLMVKAWDARLRRTVDEFQEDEARILALTTQKILRSASERERKFLTLLVDAFGPDSDPISASNAGYFVGGGK